MPAPIAITMGDPAGVGPEITLNAWRELSGRHPFFVIGDPAHFRSISDIEIHPIAKPSEIASHKLNILPLSCAVPPKPGEWQVENAAATISSIEKGVRLVQSGAASALVTNPITKKILVDGAGFKHPGHTEFLAELDGKSRSVMMLAAPELKVVPTTIHIPLCDVVECLTPALLRETIEIVHDSLVRDFAITRPRIAVAGLNPHAGESGMLGREEQDWIADLLEDISQNGIDVTAPLSADTMFHASARQSYDVAICMYHDQALIPIKTIDFDRGVNVTLGLSFIRTSPDHGTAYDIAGKGIARPDSLIHAITMAAEMAANRA